MEEKFEPRIEEVEFLELIESGFSGCPVCQLNLETVRKSAFSILYELVNDPGIRTRLREEGLCSKHAGLLFQVLEESPDLGFLGISIILEDVLDHGTKLNLFEQSPYGRKKKGRKRSHECYFCRLEREANKRHISIFARMMTDHSERKIFERSESILCLPHTVELANSLFGTPHFEEILRIQKEKLHTLSSFLKSFIAKHDYRNTIPFTQEEASAWKKALEIISGGVISNKK
ncbi:MAG: hypothetical protein J7J80_03665 [Thermotogae bacterium]|nr:hypothetical protein [Thermotogota bacterium]